MRWSKGWWLSLGAIGVLCSVIVACTSTTKPFPKATPFTIPTYSPQATSQDSGSGEVQLSPAEVFSARIVNAQLESVDPSVPDMVLTVEVTNRDRLLNPQASHQDARAKVSLTWMTTGYVLEEKTLTWTANSPPTQRTIFRVYSAPIGAQANPAAMIAEYMALEASKRQAYDQARARAQSGIATGKAYSELDPSLYQVTAAEGTAIANKYVRVQVGLETTSSGG